MGVSFFYFVRDVLQGAAQSIQKNRQMVLNTGAPRGVFPMVALARATFDLVPALVVYFLVHAVLRQPWGTSLVLLPFATLLLAMFSLGVGLLLAPAVVFVPDVGALLPYVVRIWMYVTPVMYAAVGDPRLGAAVAVAQPVVPVLRHDREHHPGSGPDAWAT